MSSVPTAPTVYEVSEIEEILAGEDAGLGDGDWYAIHTDPWPCPACGAEFDYVTACHHVIVAPDRDDLLDDVLPTMTLFQWRALGRPVHGVKKVS